MWHSLRGNAFQIPLLRSIVRPAAAFHAAAAGYDYLGWEQSFVVQEFEDFCKKSKSEADTEQKKVGKLVWLSWVVQPYF